MDLKPPSDEKIVKLTVWNVQEKIECLMTNRPCEVNDLESPFGAITTKMQLCIGDDLLRQGVIHSRSIH